MKIDHNLSENSKETSRPAEFDQMIDDLKKRNPKYEILDEKPGFIEQLFNQYKTETEKFDAVKYEDIIDIMETNLKRMYDKDPAIKSDIPMTEKGDWTAPTSISKKIEYKNIKEIEPTPDDYKEFKNIYLSPIQAKSKTFIAKDDYEYKDLVQYMIKYRDEEDFNKEVILEALIARIHFLNDKQKLDKAA